MDALIARFRKIIQLKWLPWAMVCLVLLVALLHEILRPPWIGTLTRAEQAVFWALALAGFVLLVWAGGRVTGFVRSYEQLKRRAEQAERLVREAEQRQEAILQVSQKFVEASEEKEVIELLLRLSIDLVGAMGASFVPLDEHGQPLAAISQGEMPLPVLSAWVEYLASPVVRDRCRVCESHNHLNASRACPLLQGPFSEAAGMFCLPLRRGEREFGVLNLFMPQVESLDPEKQSFLQAVMDETALALEGVRLRRRELATLRQMQALRQKTDLSALLNGLLENVQQTLEADFAILVVPDPGEYQPKVHMALGEYPAVAKPFIDGVLQGVIASGEPVLLGDVAGDPHSAPGLRSLLAAPLVSPDRQAVGALLVGNLRPQPFTPRQLVLMQTVAGQTALVVQNANLMAELEYKTVIQERTRLAREIHDGLAQTLGFLKLQVAQMQNYLARNEMERLRQTVSLCYHTLSEAFQDARQAIDGLRIGPDEQGLAGWLVEIIAEFSETSGLPVTVEKRELNCDLPPEVHAQLIRIVQEALNNVRKHAEAGQVWISYFEQGGDLWLEIRDDGRGFSYEDLSGPSRHGLRGMRERADLIGADFQVISRPQEGTRIRVRLPLVHLPFGEASS